MELLKTPQVIRNISKFDSANKTAKRTKVDAVWQIIPCIYDALAEELAAYDGRTPLLVQLKFMPSSIHERGHLKVITEW